MRQEILNEKNKGLKRTLKAVLMVTIVTVTLFAIMLMGANDDLDAKNANASRSETTSVTSTVEKQEKVTKVKETTSKKKVVSKEKVIEAKTYKVEASTTKNVEKSTKQPKKKAVVKKQKTTAKTSDEEQYNAPASGEVMTCTQEEIPVIDVVPEVETGEITE